jgi:hypothetical protein
MSDYTFISNSGLNIPEIKSASKYNKIKNEKEKRISNNKAKRENAKGTKD